MNIFEVFASKWVKEKLGVHHGREDQAIIECFEKNGVTPSKDLLTLYKVVDGKDSMDSEHFRLWSLEEINTENGRRDEKEQTAKYGVLFADFLINSSRYRVNNKGEVLMDDFINSETGHKWNSVSEFFQLMAKDPNEILY